MSSCAECGAGIQAVPFECRGCGETFCPSHRLREQHGCKASTKDARVRR